MKFIEDLMALSLARKLQLGASVVAVIFIMVLISRGAIREDMGVLYSGLDPAHAGEIITELEKRGIAYDVRGDAIFAAQDERDTLRLLLAEQGLPRQSVKGYELLDDINGFSVTSEMYNAAYWRAKEGELVRTILEIPNVQAARVHIGANLRSNFTRNEVRPTASVTLSTQNNLSRKQSEAIQYLVALAVAGLRPDEVAVIDSTAGILAGPGTSVIDNPEVAGDTRAQALEQKILRLLEPRVGPGNARVSVSIDVSRERQRTAAVVYDPESSVVRNRTIRDSSETSQGTAAGLTVASNLPQGGGQPGDPSSAEISDSTETISYEVSETRTETERLPGEVRRISVAVLLNLDSLGIDMTAPGAEDRANEVIAELEQLVLSAAGIRNERGDTLAIELMPFKTVVSDDLITPPGLIEELMRRYLWSGIQVLMLSIVVIVLALGVIRPLLVKKPGPLLEADDEVDEALEADPESPVDPFEHLRSFARERQDETAALLQDWLQDERKVAAND